MKALEILQEIDDVVVNKYHRNKTLTISESDILFIKEAISELEALKQPKSCEGCKYGTAYFGTDRKWCEANIQQDGMTTVDKDFCCNRYEAKEQ